MARWVKPENPEMKAAVPDADPKQGPINKHIIVKYIV